MLAARDRARRESTNIVEGMLELNKRLTDAVGSEREELERKIERTDRQIDARGGPGTVFLECAERHGLHLKQ